MTVKIHYQNGESYTYNGLYIDCSVEWEDGYVGLIDDECNYSGRVGLDEDVLYIEQRDPATNFYGVYTNPKYEFSVKMDVIKCYGFNKKEC